MSFWKRLLSADYRAAISAEAAGQWELAAERYALAGEHSKAARIHVTRSERAGSQADKITALRDALRWADDDAELRSEIHGLLGRALLDQVRSEGVATRRDKDRVAEAAEMLLAGGEYLAAGEAFESIDDAQNAARAYRNGGLVEQMERALSRDDEATERARTLRESFADYEMHLRIGERDAAREELRRCVEVADNKSEYRRLLDELESRLITGGMVVLRRRQDPALTAFAGETIVIGRDSLCELPLRAGGISRHHAEIGVGEPAASPRFHLRDAGSKNGTSIAGMPLSGPVPLIDTGSFSLGEHCTIDYSLSEDATQLSLRVTNGMDRGRTLLAGGPGETLDLQPATGLPVTIEFHKGRPFLAPHSDEVRLELAGEPSVHGKLQLIRGDQLVIDGDEVDVL